MKKILLLYKLNILTLSYGLNLISIPLITIFLVKFEYLNLAAEFSFFTSIIFVLCQIFSSNSRNILISDKNWKYGLDIIFLRIFLGIIFTLVIILIFFFIKTNHFEIILLYCFLIVFQWIYEIKLTFDEIEKKIKSHIFFILVYLIKILFIFKFLKIENFLFLNLTIFLAMFLYSFSIFHFITNVKIKNYNFTFKRLILNVKNNSFRYSLVSSFWNNIGIISWRFSIFIFVEKSLVAIYFICFALASLPGTVLNLTIGPTIVKEIKNKLNFIIMIIFILLSLYLGLIYNYFSIILSISEFQKDFLLKFSLFGSYFMICSILIRHYFLKFSSERNLVFKFDVLYSLILSVLVLIIYILNSKFIYLSYFFASILSFLIYLLLTLKIINAKKY